MYFSCFNVQNVYLKRKKRISQVNFSASPRARVNSYISRDAYEGRLLQATLGGPGGRTTSSGLGQDESLMVILSNDHKIIYYLAAIGPELSQAVNLGFKIDFMRFFPPKKYTLRIFKHSLLSLFKHPNRFEHRAQ